MFFDKGDDVTLPQGKGLKFVMVGQISSRKCVLEVVRTFKAIEEDYTLYLLGGGPQEAELIKEIGNSEKIHYLGKVMPSKIRKVLEKTDVLIQASRLEGWGCTTNEALLYGNKAIVSDAVGSRALLSGNPGFGTTFKSCDWQDLKRVILQYIKQGVISPQDRNSIAEWAKCLYPARQAEYLEEQIIRYLNN